MASRGVNKVILLGNLGRDPELRYMPNGNAVANFTIATSETWKDQQGQQQERTEWHNIVMYRRLAEIAGEYLKKGAKVYIEGRLQTSKWQDQQSGQDKYRTEIVANEMQMLDGRNGGSGANAGSNNQSSGYGQPQQQAPAYQQQQQPQQQQAPAFQPVQQQQQQAPAKSAAPAKPAQQQQQPQQQSYTPNLDDGWDDDIPF